MSVASFDDGPLPEADILRIALALGADSTGGSLSNAEAGLLHRVESLPAPTPELLHRYRELVLAGGDPLGEALLAVRPAGARRKTGQIFTPSELVRPMVNWILSENPDRLVDAGTGSGRFTSEALRQRPSLNVVAVDSDPVSTLVVRGTLAALGSFTARVLHSDYTTLELDEIDGRTAFIANPPYVRHHDITLEAKNWARRTAKSLGKDVSGLAGLHAYFFLATAMVGRPGDVGCFLTSAEWLDVNYGAIIRKLLLDGLGGEAIHIVDPTAVPFEGTATTAAVTCFRIGEKPGSVRFRRVKATADLDPLRGGRRVGRGRLNEARRWSPLTRASDEIPDRHVELGELCRVHRGAVTGANAVWVTANAQYFGIPTEFLFPSVTRARELFLAGDDLTDPSRLRRVIDLPEDLDEVPSEHLAAVQRFLRQAKHAGAADGYIARSRRAWWSIGLRHPAPILATYMARRPPAFVRNVAGARHINIAHGLYPRVELPPHALARLAAALRDSISIHQGRTYAGGLTKFEPKEMERLLVPDLPFLLAQ